MKTILLLLTMACTLSVSAQTNYGTNAEKGRFLNISGVNIYYESYGAGQPILLIHGNSTGIKGWKAQIDYFAKKYRVIAVDCRGRGQSELGKDSLTYLGMAADMAALINALKLDSVTVIGKSDGGIVGLLMGIYYPERIKQIVAFGANMEPDSTALFPEMVEKIHTERLNAEVMLAKGDRTNSWELERQKYRLMEFQPHITAADLGKIAVPVLVMSCDRDVIKEEHTLFIYKSIRFASLSMYPGELHRVSTLNPELFNATVDNWISQPFKGNAVRF